MPSETVHRLCMPPANKPRYVIPVRFKYDAEQWVKEIEEC